MRPYSTAICAHKATENLWHQLDVANRKRNILNKVHLKTALIEEWEWESDYTSKLSVPKETEGRQRQL